MKKIVLKSTLLILIFSTLLYGEEKKLLVTHIKARVYSKASSFSDQITRIRFGSSVNVEKVYGQWVELKSKGGKLGYVHKLALIDKAGFERQAEAINKREAKARAKGFSEEEELAVGTKGFSEEEELAAGVKGFSEEEEVSVGTKGFNKQVEEKYKKQNRGLRYDLVRKLDRRVTPNIERTYRRWRKLGELGEYGPYYQKPK